MDFSAFGVQELQMLEFCGVFFLVYSKIQEALALLNHQTDESECQDGFLILSGAFIPFKMTIFCKVVSYYTLKHWSSTQVTEKVTLK